MLECCTRSEQHLCNCKHGVVAAARRHVLLHHLCLSATAQHNQQARCAGGQLAAITARSHRRHVGHVKGSLHARVVRQHHHQRVLCQCAIDYGKGAAACVGELTLQGECQFVIGSLVGSRCPHHRRSPAETPCGSVPAAAPTL